jgi:hypothetical protein
VAEHHFTPLGVLSRLSVQAEHKCLVGRQPQHAFAFARRSIAKEDAERSKRLVAEEVMPHLAAT